MCIYIDALLLNINMPKPPKPQTAEEKAVMVKPYVAQKCPYSLKLEPGK